MSEQPDPPIHLGRTASEIKRLLICLPHFRLAFARCRDQNRWSKLLETQKRAMAGLIEELGELARKFDYRFKDEARAAESDSWRRALNMTSGWLNE